MSYYLSPGDKGSFDNIKLKPEVIDRPHKCPLCQGYGSWNLKLNHWGEGKHYRALCGQCDGYGWVRSEDAKCIHNNEVSIKPVIVASRYNINIETTYDINFVCKLCAKHEYRQTITGSLLNFIKEGKKNIYAIGVR